MYKYFRNVVNLLSLAVLGLGVTGCSSLFNPDKTISTALSGYFTDSDTTSLEMEKQLHSLVSESAEMADAGNAQSLNSQEPFPRNSQGPRTEEGSSWDKIEQELKQESSLPDVQITPAPIPPMPGQNNSSFEIPPKGQNPSQEELIRIYDQINNHDPIPQNYQPLPPLIQRPVLFDESIVISQEETSAPKSDISWKDSLEATIAHLEEELKSLSSPSGESENLQKCLQILNSVDNDKRFVDMVNHLKTLEESLPKHQYEALRKVIEATGENQSSLMEQLKTAIDHVAPTAQLRAFNAKFCTAVEGFGKVERFPEDRFRPGDEVLLYCELDNFEEEELKTSTKVSTHRCKLDAQVEFLDAKDRTLFIESFADIVDESESDRKDFYLFFRFKIPDLDPGVHKVQIRFHDKIGRKTATLESPLGFTVK